MKLYLSYVAARVRETGQVEFLAQVSHLNGGGDAAVVAHVHELLRGPSPDGIAMRAKYSHALYILDNQERASYEFPDPVESERASLEHQLHLARIEAQGAERKASAAKTAANNAKQAESEAKSAQRRAEDLEKRLAQLPPPLPAAPPTSSEGEPAPISPP